MYNFIPLFQDQYSIISKFLTMKKIITISVIALVSIITFNSFRSVKSNPTPPSGYSGAPTQNRTCRNCHNSFSLNTAGGSVVATGLPVGFYVPGKAYDFSITITNATAMEVWGFEIKAVVAGTSGTALGTFSTTNTNATVSSNELKHNNAVGFHGTSYTYTNLRWTAPSTGTSSVSFYMTGVSGDWDGSESSDYVYSNSILSIPIPVAFGSISGKLVQHSAVLEWNTFSESGSMNFEVERSSNGRLYESIGTIAAAGNSNSDRHYSYTDNNLPKNEQVLYYRLKMVDLDGKYKYSDVVILKPASETYISKVYPDIIRKNGTVNVSVISNKVQDVGISVYSLNGTKLYEQKQVLIKGQNDLIVTGFNNAASGIYLVKINTAGFSDIKKIIVE